MSDQSNVQNRYRRSRRILLGALITLFGSVGIVHLVSPDTLMPIMPSWVPHPRFVILATGICEVLGCIGLLIPSLRPWVCGSFALYGVCVFPANLKHAFSHIAVTGLPDSWWYHCPRLAFQPILIWAPLFAGSLVDWPFRRAHDHQRNRIGQTATSAIPRRFIKTRGDGDVYPDTPGSRRGVSLSLLGFDHAEEPRSEPIQAGPPRDALGASART